jgi:hypothetical protein
MTEIYDPHADPDNDDWMFDRSTTAARRALVRRLVDNHEIVATGRVASNQAPLIVKGGLGDGRIFLFRARNGVASLATAWPDQADEPDSRTVACPDLLSVDDTDDAANVFAQLLDTFGLR